MIRTAAVCLAFVVFVTLLPAEDDPAREQPKPTLKKKDQSGRGAKAPEAAQDERTKELLARVARNMESSEDRLKNRDPGEKTRAIQDQILKDLDDLIKKAQEQENQQSSSQKSNSSSQAGSSTSRQSRRSQTSQEQRKSGQLQQQAGQQKAEENASAQKKDGSQQGKQASGKQNNTDTVRKDDKGGGNTGGGGNNASQKKNTIADLFRDVWGHLPEQKRQEMDAYSRERFMPRYDELLRQYYRTLSEQSRKKDE
jgi:hypothetical protein